MASLDTLGLEDFAGAESGHFAFVLENKSSKLS